MSQQIATGVHAVLELLKSNPATVDYLAVIQAKPNPRLQECIALANQLNIDIKNSAPAHLDLSKINHQGIFAAYTINTKSTKQLINWIKSTNDNLKLVILDGVQDPRNLGSCIRTACANHCDGIIIAKHKSSEINATVAKVACGACTLLPIFAVSNLHQTILQIQKLGVWCWGLSEHAEQSIVDAEFFGHCALIFGTESTGLRKLTKDQCDYLIKIPTQSKFPSLNLAVSVGIATFELAKQLTVK